MKRNAVIALVGIAALGLSTGALADTNANVNTPVSAQTVAGPYVGVQGGFGYTNEYTSGAKQSGFAIGGTAGYKINKNFAVQADFMRYPTVTASGQQGKLDRNFSVDVALKGILPFNSFNVYGLAGAAYVHQRDNNFLGSGTASGHAYTGLVGAGFGYALTQHVEFNVQTTATLRRKNKGIPAMIATTAGVSYYF